MRWQQMMSLLYRNMFSEMEKTLDGLTPDDLKKRPSPGANSIGWLCWHTIRSCDRLVGDVIRGEQLWIKDGWHKKFNRPADINDTGVGFTDAQVDALYVPDAKTLVEYGRAVVKPVLDYIDNLTEQELDRDAPSSLKGRPAIVVRERLTGTLLNLQHIGAAEYVRGIIKGHGWYGR